MEGNETTEEYRVGELAECLKTGVTLILLRDSQLVSSHALHKVQTGIGGRGSDWNIEDDLPKDAWKVTYAGGKLQFLSSQRTLPALRPDHTPFLFGALQNGTRLRLGKWEIEVRGLTPCLSLLEGVAAPFLGTKWVLGDGETYLGRSAESDPHDGGIHLKDPTISRQHALFIGTQQRFELQALSTRSETRVNGVLLTQGQKQAIKDGDLLTFGRHLFKFKEAIPVPDVLATLRIYSLGKFAAKVRETELPHDIWQGAQVQYALALLANQRHTPLSEERLLFLLWGDEDISRKRLYNVISHLRGILREALQSNLDPILRHPGGYQLNPIVPIWHDVEELDAGARRLREALARERPENIGECAAGLLKLYRGQYLEGCSLNWAEIRRAQIDTDLTRFLSQAVEKISSHDAESALALAQRLVTIDPLCQEAYAALAHIHLRANRPREAMRYLELATTQLARAELPLSERLQELRLTAQSLVGAKSGETSGSL